MISELGRLFRDTEKLGCRSLQRILIGAGIFPYRLRVAKRGISRY